MTTPSDSLAKATPRPWWLDGSMTGPHGKFIEMICGGEEAEHPTMFLESICSTPEEARQLSANAELIVTSVNGIDALKDENLRLREALRGLSEMYVHAWDIVDGGLMMMGESVPMFEEAHEKARAALGGEQK